MRNRIKVVEIELNDPPSALENLSGFTLLKALVRLRGTSLGFVQAPITNGCCSAALLRERILEQFGGKIVRAHLISALQQPNRSHAWRAGDLVGSAAAPPAPLGLKVTVAVCTRNRVFDLARCLDSLSRVPHANLELLVVDNAPNSDSAELLVSTRYPHVRYVREPRPGLNWARNRAVAEAQGEIIAFTDDDAIVAADWIPALLRVFQENPEVSVVTGPVVPCELETEAQSLFEAHCSRDGDFSRQWIHRGNARAHLAELLRQLGHGANMAFRRTLFDQIGYFDPALDVGTVTHAGGDLEIFFRAIQEGAVLVFEPGAVVWHRHRRDYGQLRTQLAHKSIGYSSFLVRSSLAYPKERFRLFTSGLGRIVRNLGQLLLSYLQPGVLPRDLLLVQLIGSLIGLTRYQKARAAALQLAGEELAPPAEMTDETPAPPAAKPAAALTAVRCLELNEPLQPLTGLEDFESVRVYLTLNDRLLGRIEITNSHHPVSVAMLAEAIVDRLGWRLIEPDRSWSREAAMASALSAVYQKYCAICAAGPAPETSPAGASVSIVVPTRDRPEELRACLRALIAQVTRRTVEIIVVDNHPASGATRPVVDEFPQVRLVHEPRSGLAYARNAGFMASSSEIIVTAADNVAPPPNWLEKLLAPFEQRNVMAVTGAVLPCDTAPGQRMLDAWEPETEEYARVEVDKDWFKQFHRRAVPVWRLGSMSNAAFRAAALAHSRIGLLDEALGEWTPTRDADDAYFFYQVLQAGFHIVHEPAAYVWQKRAQDRRTLRRQIFCRSRGRLAYHLTTLLSDCDMRALFHLAFWLPVEFFARVCRRIVGLERCPWSWFLADLAGNLSAPWALWQSRRLVKRNGRSGFYIPVGQRAGGWWEQFLPQPSREPISAYPAPEAKPLERI